MYSNDREDKVQINLKLTRGKWQRFQVKCNDNDTTAFEVLNLFIDLYLGEEIDSNQSILSLSLETKINVEIGKYIGNKLDSYIDKYIEKKLIQEVKEIDENEDIVTATKNNRLQSIEKENLVFRDKYEYEQSSMTTVIEQKEMTKSLLNDDVEELKTARELGKVLGCSPAYITTLNRLGDLEQRGWKDSGKRQGKAILYQRITT
ncbi:MAG: hypothetical protein F6K25_31555 [Okeania sp. SIO2G4]|uniref:hypothetical protein n=1 Tax=unclassified Okeania TaxID=2634635 RepID=UPI0013B680F2|nr:MULTISPECIES: hypothetical protein [unclassified Okeania]NEP40026.1 hypothetical protein [Okeania sp. SIO2H7]NEP71139.1 hypothetical protein [Okeania sp. SIO2G5]NEP92054.1 hypothetical protein [Okeania sp. SIO2F5]NEQ94914.1 hypothetical protein [Okeania sp. SIO2G4]